MPPISSQRRAVTEEISSLSDDDVGFLYQVIAAAETKPEADRLPFRALFEAYDEVIGEHGANADPGHACLRFLFKMGSKGVRGETLFDKFENALQQMGIVIEIGEDGSTNLNETHDYDQYTVDITHSRTVDHDHSPITNGVPPTPKRRASFNTTYDIGEDPTQRSVINRPSSRSSMSRLEIGKPEFSKPKKSPTSRHDSGPAKSPDRTQLISQFLDVGRRLLSRFDGTENKHGVTEKPPLTNGVVARSAVTRDRSKRMAEASRPRRSPSYDSSDTSESEDVQSIMSQSPEHDSFDKEEAPPEFIYRPQLSDLLRDASTFNMYRQRSICRRILTQWLKKAFQARQTRQNRETLAVNYDRGLLLRQAFDPWRGVIQEKRHSARTDRFFKHLETRASRARDLYLMTKAFSHWAQLTSEEVARTSAARRHVLGVKYFNAWREITAVNELKAQRFALRRPFNTWRKKIQDLKAAETQAVSIRNIKIQKASFWDWWWCFCDRRVLEVSDYRLKRRSLLSWLRNLRTNRERDQEIDLHNKRASLKSALQIWSRHLRAIALADQEVQASRRQHDLRETFNEWRIQSRLAPAASRVSGMVDTRILRSALSHWFGKIDMVRQAEEVDRYRIQHNAWITWNDTLRCLALRARIDERIKMEAMYKWVLTERFELMRRIREQRIKREVFSRFVTNTRDTYTRLLFHAEAHEAHQTENLVRSKFAIWRDQVQLQREREYVASEFYAPRLAAESLTIWRSKHNQVVKMEGWAQDARFYFLMKKSVKQWHQAKVDSGKRRRQESYAKVRRHIKINLASKALAAWSSKTRTIMEMEKQAGDVDREKLLADASEIFVQWHDKTTKRIQDCQDADDSYFRQLAFDQMMQMSETFIIRREMEDQADNVYRLHVLRLAAASLRKLSLRIFQMGSSAETAEAMRERNLRKHSRNMFRDWVDKARMKLEARDSAGPSFTPARMSTFGNGDGAGSAMFDPWYQEPAETPFKISDLTATSQASSHDPISASPLVTPNFTTSPSKRAARARALAQMSTTPATPLRTPFASRLLRAGTTTALSTSSKRPRTGRRSSVGNSVRFVDEEPPESPTDGRRSANRRP
ncbi:RAVE complex protein Rav1 C-terminal [Penicillium desertorum]|uniref:RAVE complex protein Rav1 C-terminal n=1 Tax=Penicillium desertorum TaxID=1303715 RepID=A0A9W9WJY7_9EURO|nr:RAVE complex protein Rav1 C-terminal [Penicillium desertorum]